MSRLWVRIALSFPARALILLVALLLPWPGLSSAFSGAVAAWQNAWLSDPTLIVSVQFRLPRASAEGGPWHVVAIARERDTGRVVGTTIDVRRSGYLQLAGFLALLLPTPTSPRKKLTMALLGGLALGLLPLLPPLAFFSTAALGLRVFDLNAVVQSTFAIAYRVLVTAPGMAYAAPALVWLALVQWLDREVLFSSGGARPTQAEQRQPGEHAGS